MKREETVDFHIKGTWHALARMYSRKAQEFGLTTNTAFVLLNVNSEYGTRVTKIAPLMGLEVTSISRIMKSMEESGLIIRKPDPEDGRAVRVFLTKMGKEQKSLATETVMSFNELVHRNISKSKLDTFFEVMNKINELIELKPV
ncbi:MAG: MarR family transcriptional regulator [Cyclobacteriaceae bacterium]|nr:MarR family transcriptional regulator [Cyclobacteriaceae bacterium]